MGIDDFSLLGPAGLNIMHVDQTLEFVARQRANVGASISRLDSIVNTSRRASREPGEVTAAGGATGSKS